MEDLTPIGVSGVKLDSIETDAQGKITAFKVYRRLGYARKSAPTLEVSNIQENKDGWRLLNATEMAQVQALFERIVKLAGVV